MHIKNSDVISGSFYIRLVNKYKDYDKKQKKYIQSLIKENEELKAKIEALEEVEHDYAFDRCKSKIKNYKVIITNLNQKIHSLKEEVTSLQNKTSVSSNP